jgi:glycine cleavage system H lipoate-binding protein
MCDSFKEFNDSVKCFTAIQKVLGGYEGTVISVNRTTIVFPTARSISPSNVWLVEMKLDDPIPALPGELRYEIEIAVNRNTGVVKPYRIIQ